MAHADRQRRWRANKARKGMTRLDIWVPDDRVEGLRRLVEHLGQYPDMRLIGVMPEGSGVQGVQPPAAASLALYAQQPADRARGPSAMPGADCRASDSPAPFPQAANDEETGKDYRLALANSLPELGTHEVIALLHLARILVTAR